MELSAQVWKSVAACAHEEDEMKQTKTTWWYTVTGGLVLKIFKSTQVKYNGGGVNYICK